MGNKHSSVLIVDSDIPLLELCREVAAQLGITAYIFSSVQHASDCAHTQRFDLVLIGTDFSTDSCCELIKQLRDDGAHIPILLLASHIADPLVSQTAHLDIQGVRIKPINTADLYHLMSSFMSPAELPSDDLSTADSTSYMLDSTAERVEQQMYDTIAETVRLGLQADHVSVFVAHTDATTMELAAMAGQPMDMQVGQGRAFIDETAYSIDKAKGKAWLGPKESDGVGVPLLRMPLHDAEHLVGVLHVARTTLAHPFSNEDQELLHLLAQQAVSTIAHAQEYRQTQRRHKRLAALYEISTALAGSLDLDVITATALQQISAALPLEQAQLLLVYPDAAHPIQRRAWHAGRLTPLAAAQMPPPDSLMALVLADQTPRIQTVGKLSTQAHETTQQQETLCVAFQNGQRTCGVIELVAHSAYTFTDDDIQFLIDLGRPLALASDNAYLHATTVSEAIRSQALFEHANDAVLLLDETGQHIIDANHAMEQLAGYHRNDLRILRPEQVVSTLRLAASVPADNQRAPFEALLRAYDTTLIPVSVSASYVPSPTGQVILLIVRDMREAQRLMQQVAQTEKLAAIGRLAASIAHEVNNPLQAIYNSLNLLRKNDLNEEKRQRYLDMTFAEAERLIGIVHRLIDFHRPSRDGMRPTQVLELLDTLLEHLDEQIRQQAVTVVKEWAASQPWVIAISSHLKQVCTNLVLNALDSMPNGGTLTIRVYQEDRGSAEQRRAAQTSVQRSANRREQVLVIEFSDTGKGVAPEELPKIFEPFYTTKMTGTGLGLAISYNIIQQHGGDLTAAPGPDGGMIFKLYMPLLE